MEHRTPDVRTTDLYGRAVATITGSLAESMRVDAATIGENSRLFDELGLDSTTVLALLMTIEEEIGMEFDTDLLEQHHFETVGTLAAFVREQADEQAAERVAEQGGA
ncbi:acyl carrier protein [Streptomyces griseiscabiei]|uniref:Acyl carrier protein n=1 Tax=Streptomyces griseiscabiei TaxID=2993540 RepID=A0ABU4LDF1_9ACTN|nr:acyl carrier protein [Streptomyces griseiscabiei]MBZ3906732.1 acyl carrier protein [Streptomyces griseiscabiei]MDX2913797.1 acyl carrier protein [Streptomyces griseiscabiei]